MECISIINENKLNEPIFIIGRNKDSLRRALQLTHIIPYKNYNFEYLDIIDLNFTLINYKKEINNEINEEINKESNETNQNKILYKFFILPKGSYIPNDIDLIKKNNENKVYIKVLNKNGIKFDTISDNTINLFNDLFLFNLNDETQWIEYKTHHILYLPKFPIYTNIEHIQKIIEYVLTDIFKFGDIKDSIYIYKNINKLNLETIIKIINSFMYSDEWEPNDYGPETCLKEISTIK